MTIRGLPVLAACLLAIACSQPAGPPLAVTDIVILEPLAGPGVAAGYFELQNRSTQPITIEKVTSPEFASVEMHETVVHDGISRMISLSPLVIDPQSVVVFEAGGKHLMLSGAADGIAAGAPVTIEFHGPSSILVAVATTVRSRQDVQD